MIACQTGAHRAKSNSATPREMREDRSRCSSHTSVRRRTPSNPGTLSPPVGTSVEPAPTCARRADLKRSASPSCIDFPLPVAVRGDHKRPPNDPRSYRKRACRSAITGTPRQNQCSCGCALGKCRKRSPLSTMRCRRVAYRMYRARNVGAKWFAESAIRSST